MAKLRLAQNKDADELLSRSSLALLIGMLLDQQFPMERAFSSPYELTKRLGHEFDAAELANFDPDKLAEIFSKPPGLHRYPRSMAGRVQELCRVIVEKHAGDADTIWRDAKTGDELLQRLQELPGYGKQKSQIFLALLGKQLGVRPKGWREAAAHYGEDGSHRSIADVHDEKSLQEVRDFKKAIKAASRAKTG